MPHNLLILAAGYATRMGKMTEACAKPLLEVAGRPMMDWVMDRFSHTPGLARVVVVSNSKFFDDFVAWQASSPSAGERTRFKLIQNGSSRIEDKRGAIGDLHFAIEAEGLWDEDLVVVGGDNLFELPPADFIAYSSDKPAVIGTYDVGSPEEVRRFASIETDARGLITAFEEKPESPSGTVAGIALYAFQREVLGLIGEYLAEGNNPDQAGHLIAWLRRRVDTFGYPVHGRWFDVGSAESLAEADGVFRSL
ncbi:MAG: nucleotidyltransferase family protein [Verrucomicrobiales bacterium]